MILDLLHVDDALVVVSKPAGLLTHPLESEPQAPSCLKLLRDALGGRWLYPVHRLDRATSGVLVLARSSEAAAQLAAAFAHGQVAKRYLAVVRGHVAAAQLIDHPLRSLRGNTEPKPAQTMLSPLETVELPWPVGRYATARYALLALEPRTGRTHQLRRHMQHISHPMVGDTIYGNGAHNRLLRQRAGLERLMLHAQQITLTHPMTGESCTWNAPVARDFLSVWSCLGGRLLLESGPLLPAAHEPQTNEI